MKKLAYILLFGILLTGCEKVLMEKEPGDDPVSNFESLWNNANEKYSFFEYKNINWDDIYAQYRPQVTDGMSNYKLFTVLGSISRSMASYWQASLHRAASSVPMIWGDIT